MGGQVQGVGFRPFVYRCAVEYGLTGSIANTAAGVEIHIQGREAGIVAFLNDFRTQLPPLARVTSCEQGEIPLVQGEKAFEIMCSDTGGSGHTVLVSPDVTVCPQCRADMENPHNRRYRYPFTNCTNCGPRYTITRSIPYDRATTAMACFPLCPACHAEYTNPLDRRFHAQPNACPVCGPQLWVVERHAEGTTHPEDMRPPAPPSVQENSETTAYILPLQRIAQALQGGRIAAVKGMGGFLLACDAFNADAIALLRQRKHRPHKALAVMVPDMDRARLVAELTPAHEALLASAEAPIVVCPQKAGVWPTGIAPDGHTIGLMLPYTPLHKVLLEIYEEETARTQACDVRTPMGLVMTSGNAGGEPICLGNREALERLRDIADIFLLHNRDILVRADDSVVTLTPETGSALLYRRARGYVPRPLYFADAGERAAPELPCVMGMGAELKGTLCLTRGNAAFVSQHIGDVQNMETWTFYQEVAAHLEHLLEVQPAALVCDLHPDYLSTACARTWAAERNIPLLHLQHHAAHGWSVLAENKHHGPALVWALDGTGLGTNGPLGSGLTPHEQKDSGTTAPQVWGGELLLIDSAQATQIRLGTLTPFPLAGGDAAVREPWRVAHGLLCMLGKEWTWPAPHDAAAPFIAQMLRKGVQCPSTSSVGRLFDAVAALLGLCHVTTYEGQAAVRLQEAQCGNPATIYSLRLIAPTEDSLWRLDTLNFFEQIYDDVIKGVPVGHIARAFHLSLAQGLADMAAQVARSHNIHHVGLSGGVMQNPTLADVLPQALVGHGLQPLTHTLLPPNDGCIAFGQAAYGRAVLARHKAGTR